MVLGLYQSAAKQHAGGVDRVSWLTQQAVRWPASALNASALWLSDFGRGITTASGLARRTEELESALRLYRTDRAAIESLKNDLREAREIARVPSYSTFKKVPANVIGYFPEMRRILLDVGSGRMIKPGAPVIGAGGLIGQVVEVTSGSCYVNLVTHSDFSVGARVVRQTSQEAGIAVGQSSDEMLLSVYTATTTVASGDLITTSGLSTIYPEGLAIGNVTKVWQNKTLGIQEATVAPTVAIGRVRYAVVLVR